MHPVLQKFLVLWILSAAGLAGCQNKPWPQSPLYAPPQYIASGRTPANDAAAKAALAGHYAHYDIVAYEAQTQGGPMRTFIISYGFSDLRLEDNGKLVQYDRFCHAEHRVNQDVATSFADAATQAIVPPSTPVRVYADKKPGPWKIWRPATPALIGMRGDANLPLSQDREDPNIDDADGDGKPGVTVHLKLGGVLDAELYIARREIFEYDLTLYDNGTLQGQVVDHSEQLVLGASLPWLAVQNNPAQCPDLGLSPIMLIPIPKDMDTCAALMAARRTLFPPAPEFL